MQAAAWGRSSKGMCCVGVGVLKGSRQRLAKACCRHGVPHQGLEVMLGSNPDLRVDRVMPPQKPVSNLSMRGCQRCMGMLWDKWGWNARWEPMVNDSNGHQQRHRKHTKAQWDFALWVAGEQRQWLNRSAVTMGLPATTMARHKKGVQCHEWTPLLPNLYMTSKSFY